MKKSHVFMLRAIGKEAEDMSYMVLNSLRKFHPTDPVVVMRYEELKKIEPNINMNNRVKGLHTFIATFAKELIKEYELVISLDLDQIIMGDLNYLIDHRHEYDLGMVYNLNRIDPLKYDLASIQGIPPEEYYNLGLVTITSQDAINHIYALCESKYNDRFLYKDQDMFNIVAHFGQYRVVCFDDYDVKNNYYAWHGIKAKGEGIHMKLINGQVILPKNDNYPPRDTIIKAYHWAGGDKERKMNFNLHFKDDMCDYINWLISDTNKPYETN